MRRRVEVPGLLLALVLPTGCASQEWVQDLVSKREAQMDQKIASAQSAATAQNQQEAAQVKQSAEQVQRRLEAIDRRVGTLESQSTAVTQRTEGAWSRADGATARAEEVDARVTRLWSKRTARSVVNVLEVQFGPNQFTLDDTGKTMLLAIVREVRDNPELVLDLEGYTDSKGSHRYNVRLAQRRVDAVRRYLVEEGVEEHRIRGSARGPVADAAIPEERKRRVDVKLVVASD